MIKSLEQDSMGNQLFYDEAYKKISSRDIEWRELSGTIKAKNIISLLGDQKISTILDIGAGNGAVLSCLAKAGIAEKYFAMDISEEAVKLIKQRYDLQNQVNVGIFDGLHLPYGNKEFDVAVLSHVIEHLDDPALLLVEAARVARYLVVEVPLEDNVYTHIKIDFFKSHYRDEIGHIQWFNKRSFSDLLTKKCGLEILLLKMVYQPDEIYYFYKGTKNPFVARLFSIYKKIIRSISPELYVFLLTDHCIALACSRNP